MLHLYLSSELAQEQEFDPGDPANVEMENWLDHWYLAYVAQSGIYAFINKETKYVILESRSDHESFEEVVQRFVHRLQRFSGYNIQTRYKNFRTLHMPSAHTASPMSNMQYHVLSKAGSNHEKIEYAWNSRLVGNRRPIEVFMELLQDHVDIPFQETSVPYLRIVK